ncbi:MAG: class I SAM-dependent methyltransferase [Planctomycetes bacterium]|nr:class I SAM-dependent methyltransferase [Planctomycetota bacterium]
MSASEPGPADPTASARDAAEFVRAQREAWSAAAPGWDRGFAHFEAFAGRLGAELARRAGVAPGLRVLDVGCGHGEPALTIARLVGPAGEVVGVDLAEPMIERARERAQAAGLSNARFHAREAADLVGLGTFDAAVSRFALMLTPDPAAVARAVRGVLRPGGRFAACVWGGETEVPFCTLTLGVLQHALGLPPPALGAPGPLALGRSGALADALARGGFRDVVETECTVEPRFASVADAASFYLEGSGGVQRALAGRPAADRARLEAELVRALSAWRGADGAVVLPSRVRSAHGVAP